jgi:hypothetical protein
VTAKTRATRPGRGAKAGISTKRLDEMAAEAMVDAYGEAE